MLARVGAALAPLRERRELLLISVSTVLVMAGQGVIAPVLPLYARAFGVGAAEVGLTLSVFAVARLLLNIPLGVLSDRRGRRLLLVSGPVVTAIGMFGSGFAGGIGELLVWRFVAGAGSAMYMTGAQVYLVDISSAANRARYIGTNQGALLLGVSVGPAIGGFVAEGLGYRAPFHVVGVAALAAGLWAFLRLPETRHLNRDEDTAAGEVAKGRALRFALSADFLAVALITMAIFFTRTASRMTLMPLFADAKLGMSAGALGVLFTVMAAINFFGLAPASYVADRFGRKLAIVPSGLAVALSLAVMAMATDQTAFVAVAMGLAVSTSFAGPAPAAYVADIAPSDLRGLAMGLYRSAGDVGFVVGPPLLGAIADATSIGTGLVVNAALVGVSAVVFLAVARETAGRHAPAASVTP